MASNTTADIGIFVFHSHQNYFVNICNILNESSYNIVVFSDIEYHSKISEQINDKSITWVLKQGSETLSQYFKRIEKICNGIDLLVMFPVYWVWNLMNYYRFSPNCKKVQMIYNTNLWTMSNITFTPKLYKYLELPLRRLTLSQMDAVLVEYTPMQQYLSKKIDTDVYTFTPLLHDPSKDSGNNNNSRLTITIPGHIDPNRRDYNTFLNILESQLSKYRGTLNIQLLGCPKGSGGERIINRCNKLRAQGWDIDYYKEWISISEFNKILKTSNIIAAPLQETKKVSAVTERYGSTKASGCFGDAIRYGVPLILPAHYQVPSEVEPIISKYRTQDEFAEAISNIIEEGGLSEAARSDIAERYSITQQRTRLSDIFNLLIC
jgi:hypothetical protein